MAAQVTANSLLQDGSRKPCLHVHPFHESGSPGTRFERLIEILRLMGDLPVLKFHYADCEKRFLVVVEDIFSNPQTIGSKNAPDFEALLFACSVRLAWMLARPRIRSPDCG